MYASGRIYEGFWLKNKRHERGLENFKNGDIYVGDFVNGRPQGKDRKFGLRQEKYMNINGIKD